MGKESVIEHYLKTQAEKNGFICYKFVSPANDGVPDRVLIGHGLTFFVELKAPGEKPRALQEYTFKKMREYGAIVYVIDSKEKVNALINNLINPGKSMNQEENI